MQQIINNTESLRISAKHNSINNVISPINMAITMFFLSSLLYNIDSIQSVGFCFLIISILLLFLSSNLFSHKSVRIKNASIYRFSIVSLATLYLFELIRRISFRGFEVLICFFIALIVLYTFATIDLHKVKKCIVRRFILCEIGLLFIPLFLGNGYSQIDGGYRSFYSTTTFLGLFSCIQVELCILFYYASKDKRWLWFVAPFMIFIYLSKVRTAYIGVIIILFTLLFHNFMLTRAKGFYRLLKYILFGSIMTFVIIYPQLDRFEFYSSIEAFVYLYTGKILLSGRNEIWTEGLHYISQSPFWGYGLDTSTINISMHNSYLQIIMEIGVIGMIGILILINSILNQINRNKGRVYKLIFIFTLVNLLVSTTEVMLLQGQMVLEILVWSIMGLGLNKTLMESSQM